MIVYRRMKILAINLSTNKKVVSRITNSRVQGITYKCGLQRKLRADNKEWIVIVVIILIVVYYSKYKFDQWHTSSANSKQFK